MDFYFLEVIKRRLFQKNNNKIYKNKKKMFQLLFI